MRRTLFVATVFLVALALSGSGSAGANGDSGLAGSWADYQSSGSAGLLAIGGTPGAPFIVVDSEGHISANGMLALDGVAILPIESAGPSEAGVVLSISVGADVIVVGNGTDPDWNW